MEILYLPDSDFACLYLVALLLAGCLAAGLRYLLCYPHRGLTEEDCLLDSYECAYLVGGDNLTVSAAIASLLQQGVLEHDLASGRFLLRQLFFHYPGGVEQALVMAIHEKRTQSLAGLRSQVAEELAVLHRRLARNRLLVSPGQALLARVLPILLMAWVPLAALVKAVHDLGAWQVDKETAVLGLMTLLAIISVFGRRPHRSGRGDRLLHTLRRQYATLSFDAERSPEMLAPSEVARTLVLFGVHGLRNWPMADALQALFQPQALSGGREGLVQFVSIFDQTVKSYVHDEIDPF
jgi:uncharacterized protein (TIGR04222 family)